MRPTRSDAVVRIGRQHYERLLAVRDTKGIAVSFQVAQALAAWFAQEGFEVPAQIHTLGPRLQAHQKKCRCPQCLAYAVFGPVEKEEP